MTEDKIPDNVFILAQGTFTPEPVNHNPIVFMHTSTDPWTGVTTILDIKRRVNVGDMVLMEYAKGIVETVKVEEIVDGIVYGTAEDGEPHCSPIENCDKVPY